MTGENFSELKEAARRRRQAAAQSAADALAGDRAVRAAERLRIQSDTLRTARYRDQVSREARPVRDALIGRGIAFDKIGVPADKWFDLTFKSKPIFKHDGGLHGQGTATGAAIDRATQGRKFIRRARRHAIQGWDMDTNSSYSERLEDETVFRRRDYVLAENGRVFVATTSFDANGRIYECLSLAEISTEDQFDAVRQGLANLAIKTED